MGKYIDIDKIVPVDCPLGYDDCVACGRFELAHDAVICYAETEDNNE